MRRDVQQELKLTGEQQEKLADALGSMRGPGGRGPGGFGGPPPDPAERAAREAAIDEKVKGILDGSQYARYHELALQLEGPAALSKKSVAERVGLTADQQTKVQEIVQTARERQRAGLQQRGGGGPGGGFDPQARAQMRRLMEEARLRTRNDILAILTPEQKQQWQSLQGKAFTFQQGGGPGLGGPRGPRRDADPAGRVDRA
jgi:Spy/CpxP family protein refolding chaperone